ncbi:sodium/potassium-transporting ATPase subunit beta-1-interacting protein isoform X1 [Ceratitis capitata]|uniref:Sodium/potassium-transporting ATPase subunit beta-1-interacting protein n=1 Tax=Ceratitis capitata TaxID=7213 RepID=W8BF39_CERCA|nr:sodium/potassium-transporting ATPase subunit beta-1-interacting protein isoform X1 [Ceratitis capitata]XP_004535704.1 sodium/potassium-transporting ATPase subunit beta-1-interacting protein isoform X1 [Ceratitis capitata]XP_004535705.1 sodium/potassium-transporting ATPase subunit beta-1-interacting protein isoform X1 [Ceratitis capitata]XP_004535706.1 sodium/potassium-transporting ATPase subunit beta-1-interacting protein isoform X1 [Ceratitis capitata]XP_004535708.1 sodium/potassium-transpo
MGSCTRRHFMLSTCLLQMITVIQRQVFDFLGYMWAPILVNFFHIIFIILGFYGAYHFRIKYIITYLIWGFIWIGWNAFLICFYLNVGLLDRDSDLLNLGTGSVSWFEVNGYGCKPTYPVNITSNDPFRPIRPEHVDDCLLDYTIVEIIQSGVQCTLALFGILSAILISYIFLDEDDRFDFVNGDAKSPQHTVVHPMYVSYSSIPTSASASATLLSNKHHNNHQEALNNNNSNNSNNQQLQLHQQQQLHHQQPENFNSNTFLIHTNTVNNNSHSHSNNHTQSHSNRRSRSRGNSNNQSCSGESKNTDVGVSSGQSHYPYLRGNSTITRILYSPKNSNKIASSTGNTIAPTDILQRQQSLPHTHTTTLQSAHYYDDSTAKADQLYTNSNRRQFLNGITYQQQQHAGTTNSSMNDNTTSSLSYASLQNSNLNLTQSLRGVGGGQGSGFIYMSAGKGYEGGGGISGGVCGVGSSSGGGFGRSFGLTTASSQATLSPLSNSQFSLTNSINNNYSNHNVNNNNHVALNNLTNYTINNNNNNGSMDSSIGGGRFARIHSKPKPPKSTSYSSFINNGSAATSLTTGNVSPGSSMTNVNHSDKYSLMSNERLSRNLEEGLEDDTFSLQNFRTEDGTTYVPFQKPTPGAALFVGQNNKNNNPSYVSLNSYAVAQFSPNNNNNNGSSNALNSNNNSMPHFERNISQPASPPLRPQHASEGGGGNRDEILLERGAILQPAHNYQTQAQHLSGPPRGVSQHQQPQPQSILNPANRFLYQQNGMSFHPAYNKSIPVPSSSHKNTHSSPSIHASYHHLMMNPIGKQPPRPTNIPLPTIPTHTFDTPVSPSEVTPPPPPTPRPHIFQPRSGHAPYPDLSPEVTEKYSMPTQYVPRSPVASRIARRQRQLQQPQNYQHHHNRIAQPTTHHANISSNFCDQVRDAPPGYIVEAGFSIVRAKSYDRLASASSTSGSVRREGKASDVHSQAQINTEAAPHVNRRSGRRDIAGRVRPSSYCNSMSGGEGVIRGSLVYECDIVAESGVNGCRDSCDAGGSSSGVEASGRNIGGDQLA